MGSGMLACTGTPTRAGTHGHRPRKHGAVSRSHLGCLGAWAVFGLLGKLRHGELQAFLSTLPGGLACADFPLNCKNG